MIKKGVIIFLFFLIFVYADEDGEIYEKESENKEEIVNIAILNFEKDSFSKIENIDKLFPNALREKIEKILSFEWNKAKILSLNELEEKLRQEEIRSEKIFDNPSILKEIIEKIGVTYLVIGRVSIYANKIDLEIKVVDKSGLTIFSKKITKEQERNFLSEVEGLSSDIVKNIKNDDFEKKIKKEKTTTETNTTQEEIKEEEVCKTGFVLMPSAYVKDPERFFGINGDIFFTGYIGEILGKFHKQYKWLDQILLWILGADLKWNIIKETDFVPAVTFGGYGYSMLKTVGGQFDFSKGQLLGTLYFIMGYNFFNKFSLHSGYGYGTGLHLIKYISPEPTREQEMDIETKHTLYFGMDSYIIPNFNIKIEVILPFEKKLDLYMVNVHFEKLFGFDFSFLKFKKKGSEYSNYSIMGSYNFRFTVLPN